MLYEGGWVGRPCLQFPACSRLPACLPQALNAPIRSLACAAVHNNLLSNINVGAGTRPFSSSGDAMRGSHAGRWA